MTLQETIQHAKDLLRTSIPQTLAFLMGSVRPDREGFDTLISLEGRYRRAETEMRQGTLKQEDWDYQRNQIVASLISLLNSFVPEDIHTSGITISSEQVASQGSLLDRLREAIAEVERLKVDNQTLRQTTQHRLKIVLDCNPKMEAPLSEYTCYCYIMDYDTGKSTEREVPLLREPGSIVAMIHDIKPSDLIRLRLTHPNQEWESVSFSSQFVPLELRTF